MRAALPTFRTLVLDAEGLSKAATRDPTTVHLLARAADLDAPVLVPWTVLAETLHGTGKQARQYALSRFELLPLTEQHYRDAAALMDAAGLAGKTIAALVVAAALGCPRPVVIVTSDLDDLERLAGAEPDVAVTMV